MIQASHPISTDFEFFESESRRFQGLSKEQQAAWSASLGERAASLRIAMGLTQKQTADFAEISKSALERLEESRPEKNGIHLFPPFNKLEPLAKILGISPRELLMTDRPLGDPKSQAIVEQMPVWKKRHFTFTQMTAEEKGEHLRHLAARFAAARLSKEYTQDQLARKARNHPNTIKNIEKASKYPSFESTFKLANALGAPIDELLSPQKPFSDPRINALLAKIMPWERHHFQYKQKSPSEQAEVLEKIGALVRAFRENAKVSQSWLRKKTGISLRTLGAMEVEKNYFPSLNTALAMSAVMEIPMEKFLTGGSLGPNGGEHPVGAGAETDAAIWRKKFLEYDRMPREQKAEYALAVGNRLLALRMAAGLTNAKVSSAAGIASGWLSRIEVPYRRNDADHGFAREETFLGLAKALGVSLREILSVDRPLESPDARRILDQCETWKRKLADFKKMSPEGQSAYLEGLGNRITGLRNAKGWDPAQLAGEAKLRSDLIPWLRRPKTFPWPELSLRISKALGVSLAELL